MGGEAHFIIGTKAAQLQRQVAVVQTSLCKIVASHTQMAKLRAEETDAAMVNEESLEDDAIAGESEGIIAWLEKVLSESSKNLTEVTATGQIPAAAYEKLLRDRMSVTRPRLPQQQIAWSKKACEAVEGHSTDFRTSAG